MFLLLFLTEQKESLHSTNIPLQCSQPHIRAKNLIPKQSRNMRKANQALYIVHVVKNVPMENNGISVKHKCRINTHYFNNLRSQQVRSSKLTSTEIPGTSGESQSQTWEPQHFHKCDYCDSPHSFPHRSSLSARPRHLFLPYRNKPPDVANLEAELGTNL